MHEKFTRGMLKQAKVPHWRDVNGKDIDAVRVRIKLFDLESGWAWYIAGADELTGTCFGFESRGQHGGEIAYFQLKDLNAYQGKYGVSIKRSTEWNPQTSLADVIEERVR